MIHRYALDHYEIHQRGSLRIFREYISHPLQHNCLLKEHIYLIKACNIFATSCLFVPLNMSHQCRGPMWYTAEYTDGWGLLELYCKRGLENECSLNQDHTYFIPPECKLVLVLSWQRWKITHLPAQWLHIPESMLMCSSNDTPNSSYNWG